MIVLRICHHFLGRLCVSAKSMVISSVIVTYNNEPEITPCLQSLAQEYHKFSGEVVLVDNASDDSTSALIAAEKTSIPGQIQFLQNDENRGFTKGLNQGLALIQGEYVLILNPDIVLKKGSLMQLISFLRQNNLAAVVAPQLLNPDGSVQPSCRRFPTYRDILFEVFGLSRLFPLSARFNRWKMGDFDHLTTAVVEQPQGAFLFFHRGLLAQTGMWDERFPMFFSDVDWCRRVTDAGLQIWYYPEVQSFHKKGASIYQRRPAMIISSHKSFYRYLKKYYAGNRFFLANEVMGCILAIAALFRIAVVALRKD